MGEAERREWMEARGVERAALQQLEAPTAVAEDPVAHDGMVGTRDYRAWMEKHEVERLDRVSSEDFPYFRLRAYRVDGVYAITVLQPHLGGPPFDEVLQRLADAIAIGPTSPAWMGVPAPR
jgi:hypothetical protein